MKTETLRELMIDELQDLHSAEQQIVKALPKLVKAAHNPNLKQAFEHHLEETKNHVTRLDNIFKRLNESPKGKTCEGMKGLLKEGEERISDGGEPKSSMPDSSPPRSASSIMKSPPMARPAPTPSCSATGKRSALLNETLEEEKAADAKLTQVARTVNVEAKAA